MEMEKNNKLVKKSVAFKIVFRHIFSLAGKKPRELLNYNKGCENWVAIID